MLFKKFSISSATSTNLDFHPVGFSRGESSVEGDGLVNDDLGGVDADEVEDRGLDGVLLRDVAGEVDVGPPDVLLHQRGEVGRVHVVGEVIFVDLQQVVRPLVEVISEVVPEQVVQHRLGDARGAHVGDVPGNQGL